LRIITKIAIIIMLIMGKLTAAIFNGIFSSERGMLDM